LEDQVLVLQQNLLPEGDPDIAYSLYLVGDRLRQRGELDEACSILNAALSMQTKALGKDNPAVLYTQKSLGFAYEAQSKWSEAETMLRETLAAWRRRAGDNDPGTLYALRDLADALEGEGKWREAEELYWEALPAWRAHSGDTDPDTLDTLHRLGVALNEQKKWPGAEIVYREEVASARKRAGDDDPSTLFALRELGITLEFAGKWTEAESVHREELALWRKRAGNDDPDTLFTLDRLGWSLEGESKWSDAEGVYREALASRRKKLGNENQQTLAEYERLTSVLMSQDKLNDVEQLLSEALTPTVIGQVSNSNLLIRKLDLMGREERWQEAATAAVLVVKYNPADEYRYHTFAALLAVTQNHLAYETLCRQIFATFSNTGNAYIDERVAKDCLLVPDSGVDLKLVDELADKSVSLGSSYPDELPYIQVTKAMSAYRLGHFAEAIEWAAKTLKGPIVYANANAYAVLAMAHWQLGQKDEARFALSRGHSLEPNALHPHGAVDLGDPWVAWLIADISLNEADTLIQSPPSLETDFKE
jgi:tetratricopeptide (TPR) repeat protein